MGAHIRAQMPWFPFGGKAKRKQWLDTNLAKLLEDVQRLKRLSSGDMPTVADFRGRLADFEDPSKFPSWSEKEFVGLNRVIDKEVPKLISRVSGVSDSSMGCSSDADAASS